LEFGISGGSKAAVSAAFSPDGQAIAVGLDEDVWFFDQETRKPLGPSARAHSALVNAIEFRPDGRLLATGSRDGTIVLWNASTRLPIAQPFRRTQKDFQQVFSMAFAPDGRSLGVAYIGGDLAIIDADGRSWKRKACQIANRNFSLAEWAQYLPSKECSATCPGLPKCETWLPRSLIGQ
jgi:WD40 repeat protein